MSAPAYDILVKNGHVIDPAAGRNGRFDVAIANGLIAAVEPEIDPALATETIDVEGKLVLPGMVDTHAHVFEKFTGRFGLNPDLVGVRSGVTTVIDAGGCGWMSFPAFRHFIAERAKTRVLSTMSIYVIGAPEGNYYPDLYGPDCIDVERAVACAEANRDLIKAIKTHGEIGSFARWGLDVFLLAKQATREAKLPLYLHLGQLWPMPHEESEAFRYKKLPTAEKTYDADRVVPEVLECMDPGDILAHPFTYHPGGFVDSNGKIHPIIREALAKGLRIDVGHGSHFTFDIARRVLDAGIRPFTLGADMHGYNIDVPIHAGMPLTHPDDEFRMFRGGNFSLTYAMTELMAVGMPLEEVVAMVTSNCAVAFGLDEGIGTLKVGGPGDVSVIDDMRGKWVLQDSSGGTAVAERYLQPLFCLRAGERFDVDAPILPRHEDKAA